MSPNIIQAMQELSNTVQCRQQQDHIFFDSGLCFFRMSQSPSFVIFHMVRCIYVSINFPSLNGHRGYDLPHMLSCIILKFYTCHMMTSEQVPFTQEDHGMKSKTQKKGSKWTFSLEYFITDTVCVPEVKNEPPHSNIQTVAWPKKADMGVSISWDSKWQASYLDCTQKR